MHSVEADSIWLWSFIWTWQEAAAAETHQREALWGEDQIRASDARMDPAKRRPWIHTHTRTHTHAHIKENCFHTSQHTAKAFSLIPHFPIALIVCLHAQLCTGVCAHTFNCKSAPLSNLSVKNEATASSWLKTANKWDRASLVHPKV